MSLYNNPELYSSKENYGSILDSNLEEDLKNNYTNPGHPIAFSGITNVYKYYKGGLSVEKIKDILSTIENYSLHREYKRGQRNPSYSHFKRYQFQMDLVDIQSLFPVKKVIDKQYGKDTISGSLGKVSLFENTEYDVLKFEVESEDLQELNKICKTLPYTSDYPDYHPHCTISYIKKGTCKDLVGKTIKNNTFSTSELFFSNKDSVKTNFSLATIEKKSNLTLWQKLSNGLSKKTK